MNQLRFSIIIPVFNSKDYIQDCIESLCRQSYKNFEVIIINDGSTDGSGELCEHLANIYSDFVIRVCHQENLGQIEARYNGVRCACGEYCCFLDSDDTFTSDALKELARIIDIYSSDVIIFNGQRCLNGDSFPFWQEYNQKEMLYIGENIKKIQHDLIFSRRFNNLAFKSIKTSILQDSLIYHNVTFIREEEDLMMQLPIFDRVKSIVYLPQLLYNYRLNPTSVTGRYNSNRFIAKAYVLNERLRYAQRWGFEGFDSIRFEILAQSVRRTIFLLRNIITDNIKLAYSEIRSMSCSKDFRDLYLNRKNNHCGLATKILIRLIYKKCYLSIMIVIFLLRLVFGRDKYTNTVLKKAYFDESLNG